MHNKNINISLFVILSITTLAVFTKNFYNEILQKYLNNPDFFQIFFSDFYLIFAGSEILSEGNNPYKEWIKINKSPFFNPPIVFYFFKFITNFAYSEVVKFWLIFLSISFISIPVILFKIFKTDLKFVYIFLISFGGLSASVFLTGNLSVILYALFATSLFFLSKGKEHFFYIILSILSLIKFPYLIFFGIPFLLNGLKKNILIMAFFYLIIVASIYFLYFYFNNELFISWLNSLKLSQSIGDGGDFGRGIFRILDSYFLSDGYSRYIFYFIISTSLFIFLIFLFEKSEILNGERNKSLAIAFSIVAMTILLPRLKSYDVLIAIPPLFYIIQTLSFKISKNFESLIKFFLFLMLFCWTSPYAPISLCSIIFLIFSLDLKFNFIDKE